MDLHDVQGLVFHSYRAFPHAAYVRLTFEKNPYAVKRWLALLLETQTIDSAAPKERPRDHPGVRVNIALSFTGLAAAGLNDAALRTFPSAFVEGLGTENRDGTPDHRARALGDVDESAPAKWVWGYQGQPPVDAVLLVYATDTNTRDAAVKHWTDSALTVGAIALGGAPTMFGSFPETDAANKEAFGFVDGISQPVLKGGRDSLGRKDRQPDSSVLEDGEILLGHRDASRMLSWSPTVSAKHDPLGLLRPAPEVDEPLEKLAPGDRPRDLGYNGTFLVFRQLAQDVDGFNLACQTASESVEIPVDRFKALLVGRWQDGSPIVKCPIANDRALEKAPAANDFGYRSDPNGERCPIGSHIRRANPRDSLGDDPEESWRVTKRHRILRRGRPYRDSRGEQGLHFICLNADIVRQFEFIQQNWINDATFGGLDGEDDPLAGPRQGRAAVGTLTLPAPPEHRLRRRVAGLTQFVTVKGGGYFFLPSLTALHYLAEMPMPRAPRSLEWQPAPPALTGRDRVRLLFLSRFSLLLALTLIALPLSLLVDRLVPIVRPVFLLSGLRDMMIVSALASLTAAVAMLTFRIVELYASLRFGVETSRPQPLTWRRVLRWQAATLPIVGTAWALSAGDATFGRLRELAAFGFAAVVGYLGAFAIVFVAAAARQRSVRADNPEDAALLPPSRLQTRLKAQSSIILRIAIAGRAVRFIESRAATWPTDHGTGYVDHETGRILPGHLAAMTLVATIGLVYATGWWGLRPPDPPFGFQLPPLAYVLFLLLINGWAAAAAAFFLDRYRFPLVTAIAAWLALVTFVGGSDYEFAVKKATLTPAPGAADVIASADAYYRNRAGSGSSDRPVIVVAAGGGGIYQAAWTARVLTGLTDLWGPAFSENVRLISAVSGGSVGAIHYVNQFTNAGPPRGDLQHIVDAAKTSTNGDVWWGFAYPDLLRVLLPFRIKRLVIGQLDRGWALEKGWHRALGLSRDAPEPTMGDWQADALSGWRPAIAFNATIVESGKRAVLATYAVRGSGAADLASIIGTDDVSVITAARLSAAFPYVTPFARPTSGDTHVMNHLADGGYWDNDAVATAIEWLRAAAPVLTDRKVLLIRIPAPRGPERTGGDQSWVWQGTAPLAALGSAWMKAQQDRNAREIDLLASRAWERSIRSVEIPHGRKDAPVSWHLSRSEGCDVEKKWRAIAASSKALTTIAEVLGDRVASETSLPLECSQ